MGYAEDGQIILGLEEDIIQDFCCTRPDTRFHQQGLRQVEAFLG